MKPTNCALNVLRIAAASSHKKYKPWTLQINENETKYIKDAILISLLLRKFALKYEILEQKEAGVLLPNGSWSGVIGMVQREEADLAIGNLLFTEERRSVVDFALPFGQDVISFMTDKPHYLPDTYAVLHPFSASVWIIVAITFIIYQIIQYFFEYKKYSFGRMIFENFAILMGTSTDPLLHRKNKSNLLIISWIFGAFFIGTAYKAVLLSSITFPTLIGIRTAEELAKAAEKNSFKCAAFAGSSLYYRMLDSAGGSLKKIAQCLKRTNWKNRDEQFMEAVLNRKAFIGPKMYLKIFEQYLYISDDTFTLFILGIFGAKSFPCKEELVRFITRLAATGVLDKILRDELFFDSFMIDNVKVKDYDPLRTLKLEDFYAAFIVLAVGLSVATVIFITKFIYYKIRRKEVSRKNFQRKKIKARKIKKIKMRQKEWHR